IGIMNFQLQHPRRIKSDLLIGHRENFTVMQSVGGAQNAPGAGKTPDESQSRGKGAAIASVRDLAQAVDLGRRYCRLKAKSVVEREIRRELPAVAHVESQIDVTEAAVRIADAHAIAAGEAKPEIGDGIMAEVVLKGDDAPLTAEFTPIDLAAHDVETGGDG